MLVSLSGITPRTLHRCAELAAELDRRHVPMTMLFTPRSGDAATAWMSGRVRQGDAILLRGNHSRGVDFASLPAHEARLRLIAAVAGLDRAGLRAEGFAPPGRFASRGTLEALREHGFGVCADLAAVHDLRSGAVLRSRVQGFGSQRQRTETLRCFALVLTAARAARRSGLVRLGVDADDLLRPGRRQAFLDAVDVARENGAVPSTYSAIRKRLAVAS
ncbi:DUF2334 domain-containing protein [Amycolatopsis antarctica]|uniref:DUF2334 domain-containing protein n=1 Tax=Amycolatopsis antarctica TaxID=1854586 RepID=A0A263D1P0_9PSEU|nr:DUF2334 domain-containing protein [Amycolatopsis antarctica]